jgi:hypothetical protein
MKRRMLGKGFLMVCPFFWFKSWNTVQAVLNRRMREPESGMATADSFFPMKVPFFKKV